MKRLILGLLMLFTQKSLAEVITVTGMPPDYNIYRWNYADGEVSKTDYKSGTLKTFKFDIPTEYIVRNDDHSIDLWRTLENWRVSTPVAPGNPRTVEGNGTFPFMQDYDPVHKKLPTADHHIALAHIIQNTSRYPDLKFESNDGSEISVKVPSLVAKLQSIAQNPEGSVSCRSNSKKSHECLICNCANESWVEAHEGRVGINRTVLRRLQTSANYFNPDDTICGVIWAPSQFSWTFAGMSQPTVSGNMLKECAQAAADAVTEGPWKYESFYNPNTISKPDWARTAISEHTPKYPKQQHAFVEVRDVPYKTREEGKAIIQRAVYGTE